MHQHLQDQNSLLPRNLESLHEKLKDPSLLTDIPFHDPVAETLSRHFPSAESSSIPTRRLLPYDPSKPLNQHLQNLLTSHSFHAILALTASHIPESPSLSHTLSLWHLRLTALISLKKFDSLLSELFRILELASALDSRSRRPLLNILILWALAPYTIASNNPTASAADSSTNYNNTPAAAQTESLNRLCGLLYEFRNDSLASCRIRCLVAGMLGAAREMGLAETLLREVYEEVSLSAGFAQGSEGVRGVTRASAMGVLSALGKLHLQGGNVEKAREVFEEYETKVTAGVGQGAEDEQEAFGHVVVLHKGLLAMAKGDFESAATTFTKLLTTPVGSHPVVISNLSLSYLYMGDVGRCLSLLESLTVERPVVAGTSLEVLFHLSMVYDLADQSLERKRRLLGIVVASAAGDDFEPGVLKF
jgi:hypothetical protein